MLEFTLALEFTFSSQHFLIFVLAFVLIKTFPSRPFHINTNRIYRHFHHQSPIIHHLQYQDYILYHCRIHHECSFLIILFNRSIRKVHLPDRHISVFEFCYVFSLIITHFLLPYDSSIQILYCIVNFQPLGPKYNTFVHNEVLISYILTHNEISTH